MNPPRFSNGFQQPGHAPGQPPGLLARIVSAVVMGALFFGALMFSAALFAVLLVFGLGAWGWFWWKTREVRKTMREGAPRRGGVKSGFGAAPGAAGRSTVIEGEVIREVREGSGSQRPY